MLRTPPTEPAIRVGPCMQHESSSTTSSSLGRPPSPTLMSLGSSSWVLPTAIAASSVSLPLFSISYPWSIPFQPLALETRIGALPLPEPLPLVRRDGSCGFCPWISVVCALSPRASELKAALERNSLRENAIRGSDHDDHHGYRRNPK